MPEQIRECHGEVTEHPCEQQPKDQPSDEMPDRARRLWEVAGLFLKLGTISFAGRLPTWR